MQGYESACGSHPPSGYLPRWGINENLHPIQYQIQVVRCCLPPPNLSILSLCPCSLGISWQRLVLRL